MKSSSSCKYNPGKSIVTATQEVYDYKCDEYTSEDIVEDVPSDCEDENGNRFEVGNKLGEGVFDIVSSLDYVTYEKSENGKLIKRLIESNMVIIKSRNKKLESIYAKKEFYSILNPKYDEVCLYEIPEKNITRLRVPKALGEPCMDIKDRNKGVNIDSLEEMLIFCLAVIKKIKICHAASRIIIDLKIDNVFYDIKTKECTLIDGGSSLSKGSVKYTQLSTPEELACDMLLYCHLAPEYMSGAVPAHESMDVYPFGVMILMMIELMQKRYPHIQDAHTKSLIELMTTCKNMDPLKRPTMQELENKLGRYLLEIRGEKLQGKFALSFFAPDRIEFLLENTVTNKNYNL